MAKLRFPVGIETFSELREKGYVYVDKTEYIHRLVTDGKYFFLSRPRRFGKSLLLSTIKSFFEGRRDLFDGLAITRYNHSWKKHPVFHINFVNADTSSPEGVKSILQHHISGWEKLYEVTEQGFELPQRFYAVIRKAVELTGMQAVVLIDEYDKAFVNSLDNEELHNQFRNILKPVFATLKAADQYICFGILTGITRFSRLSIFSDINNLSDISLESEYAAICGITESEMLTFCKHGIEDLSNSLDLSFEGTVNALKRNYDGYHFSKDCPDIYNPYSVMSAFRKKEIGSYWFATGTPTFLIDALRNTDIYLPELIHSEADTTELADIDSYKDSPVAMLFQTGYLTLKGYDRELSTYQLGIPNREVSEGFFKDLLPVFMNNGKNKSMQNIRTFCRDVLAGEPESFLTRLQSFLADIPYDLSKNKPEVYFENNLYIIFKLMGFNVETEYRTSAGRIDICVKTADYLYVMELKLNGTAEEAISQIEERGYYKPFMADSRKLFKIGISFSAKTRNIDNWIILS